MSGSDFQFLIEQFLQMPVAISGFPRSLRLPLPFLSCAVGLSSHTPSVLLFGLLHRASCLPGRAAE